MIEFIIVLVVVGFVLYLLNLVPIDGTIKQIIRTIVILLVVLYAIDFALHLAGHAGHSTHKL